MWTKYNDMYHYKPKVSNWSLYYRFACGELIYSLDGYFIRVGEDQIVSIADTDGVSSSICEECFSVYEAEQNLFVKAIRERQSLVAAKKAAGVPKIEFRHFVTLLDLETEDEAIYYYIGAFTETVDYKPLTVLCSEVTCTQFFRPRGKLVSLGR